MLPQKDHQIFFSYVSDDRERVLPFYDSLTKIGFNVWMDFVNFFKVSINILLGNGIIPI